MKKKILISILAVTLMSSPKVYASDVIWPDDCYAMCEEISAGRIQPEFIQAVIERESNYDAAAGTDCIGLMQVSPKWHKERMERLGVTNLKDPYENIVVGTDILVELFGESEDPYWVLMHYNMRQETADRLYDAQKWSEYAIGVCVRAAELERLHGK